MRLKKLIKTFALEEANRNRITLGAKVRLHPSRHRVMLKEQADGTYSTDADLYVKSWITNPANARQWLGFEAEVVHKSVDDVVVTSSKYRLGDGTDERYWDGGAWAVAGATDWNTEAEIAANIDTFPVTAQKIQVIANLKTTDKTVTPELVKVKVLYDSDIEFQEDLIYRTLVRQLRNNLRPITEYPIKLARSGATIDLRDYPLDTPYNIAGIDAAFNHTDDPGHWTDIFSSYDAGTKKITLTGSVASGKTVWVRFFYEPEVSVSTSRDFYEVGKIPAVILEDVILERASELGQDDWVLDKTGGTGTKVHAPLRGDLGVTINLTAEKGVDLERLADEMKRFFANNPTITSLGLDEEYRLWLRDEFDLGTTANLGDIHSARLRCTVVDALFWEKEFEDAYPVQRLNLTGDLAVTI